MQRVFCAQYCVWRLFDPFLLNMLFASSRFYFAILHHLCPPQSLHLSFSSITVPVNPSPFVLLHFLYFLYHLPDDKSHCNTIFYSLFTISSTNMLPFIIAFLFLVYIPTSWAGPRTFTSAESTSSRYVLPLVSTYHS